jgi:hypothetical protein
MRLFFFVLAVLALAATTVRADDGDDFVCPPEGYTKISQYVDLSRLAPYGKYAICSLDNSAASDINITGPRSWRMSNSELIVDGLVRINVLYPAVVDFSNVIITNATEAGWRGLRVFGAPAPGTTSRRSYHHQPPTGNCGKFENVDVGGVVEVQDADAPTDDPTALGFFYCSDKTTIKRIGVIGGYHSLSFISSQGLVVYDANVASGFLDNIDDSAAGILVRESRVTMVNPFVVHEDHCLHSFHSYLTLCSPFFLAEANGDTDTPSFALQVEDHSQIAISRPTNIVDGQINIESGGGVVYFLKKCPSVFQAHYDMHTWTQWKSN